VNVDARPGWPALPVAVWVETRDTLHMWTQIIGKIRLALAPLLNEWWQVTLAVNAHGLTTGLMPYGDGGLEISFDFRRHVLAIATVEGGARELRLEPRSVADFYTELFARLGELDVDVPIFARPVEVEVAIPFAEDEEHRSYDADAVHQFWRSLDSAERVLTKFRSRFVGKASPVQFFWGSFDLATTRFSGSGAPRHPGGMPNCPAWVMEWAYDQELSSCGYWPGGADEGVFYSYTYPEPPGFPKAPIAPSEASFDDTLGEFVLPYAAVRRAPDPDALLLEFLQTTYDAAAELAHWDRDRLEADVAW
jgi:hypothetical protein